MFRRALSALLVFTLLWAQPGYGLPPVLKKVAASGVSPTTFGQTSADLNFASNGGVCTIARVPKSCLSLISTTRATPAVAYAQTSYGLLVPFAANVPRITDQGLLVEEARTNKSTNYNANPNGSLTNLTKSGDAAATLTEVDDTAALLAAGLQNIATSGKVFLLDNTAGVAAATVVMSGAVGNMNSHTVSIWIRGGTGRFGLFAATGGAIDAPVFGASATFVRRTHTATPDTNTRVAGVRADAGQVVYFILNQLEEGAFVTSPIVIAGSSATRAADVISLTGAAATAALAAKAARAETNLVAGGTPTVTHINYSGGTTFGFASSTTVEINNPSINATIGGAGTYAGLVKTAYGFDATGVSVRANGGTAATSATPLSGQSGTVRLANRAAGDRALNGYMRRATFGPNKGMFDGLTQ